MNENAREEEREIKRREKKMLKQTNKQYINDTYA